MISVIVPLYNKKEYLEECIDSIYESNFDKNKLEVIIVEDGGTDNPQNILNKLQKKYENLEIIYQKNRGLPAARNIGITSCTGQYIVCLDADDKIPNNYLEENYLNIIQSKVDVSYTDVYCFGISSQILHWPEFSVDSLRKGNYIHCAAMFNKDVWKLVGGYDELMVNGLEDYDLWLRFAKIGAKFKKTSKTFLWWRKLPNSMTTTLHLKLNEVHHYLKTKHGDWYHGQP